jgi:hypothetical protein
VTVPAPMHCAPLGEPVGLIHPVNTSLSRWANTG